MNNDIIIKFDKIVTVQLEIWHKDLLNLLIYSLWLVHQKVAL